MAKLTGQNWSLIKMASINKMAVTGAALLFVASGALASDTDHTIEDLSYGQALYQSLVQDPLSGLMPLEIALERQELLFRDEGSPYPFLYHADLQFRFGLNNRAQAQFKQLSEALQDNTDSDQARSQQALQEVWARLGGLLYQDGQYQQSLEMLLQLKEPRTLEQRFLIDDIHLRLGSPMTLTHSPLAENTYYLQYRKLLTSARVQTENTETENTETENPKTGTDEKPELQQADSSQWPIFLKDAMQLQDQLRDTDQSSPSFNFMIDRAQLSAALLGLQGSLKPFLPLRSNTHYLKPLVAALVELKPPVISDTNLIAEPGVTSSLYQLLGLFFENLTDRVAFDRATALYNELAHDLDIKTKRNERAAFSKWFQQQIGNQSELKSLTTQFDWLPWLGSETVRRQLENVKTLDSVQASLDAWEWRLPFLSFVLEQNREFYEESATSLDLTEYETRLAQMQFIAVGLNQDLEQAEPVDNSGLLYNPTLTKLDNVVKGSYERLQRLLEAGLISQDQFTEKSETLRRAQGRILWDADQQWSGHFRKASKQNHEIVAGMQEARARIERIRIGAAQWQGENFARRFIELQSRLKKIRETIAAQRQLAFKNLENSAFNHAQKLNGQQLQLGQIALQNKLVYAERLYAMQLDKEENELDITPSTLTADYQLLLNGPLALEDRAQARLGLAEHLFTLGEDDPTVYVEAIAQYKKWLYESQIQHLPSAREAVLYRIAQAYALMTEQEQSIAVLEQIAVGFPTGNTIDEVLFRLAEDAYANGEYEKAVYYYQKQVTKRPNSNLTLKSNYMLGWSFFKLGKLDQSLDQFLTVLNVEQAQDQQVKQDQDLKPQEASTITSLQDDAERITQVVLERAGGVQMLGKKFSAPLSTSGFTAYSLYFDALREKELYFKLYESVEFFQQRYPQFTKSPGLAVDIVKLLKKHSFFEAQREQQALFITRYVGKEQFANAKEINTQGLEYALELGDYHRSLVRQQSNSSVPLKTAAGYYELALQLWPSQTPQAKPVAMSWVDLNFRLADTYFDLQEYEKSLPLYRQLAYEDSKRDVPPSLRQKAGLAHIAALQSLAGVSDAQPVDNLNFDVNAALQKSRVLFMQVFATHTSAPQFRLEAAAYELEQNQNTAALALITPLFQPMMASVSQSSVNQSPPVFSEFELTVVDIAATAYYNTQDYDKAAKAYELGLTNRKDPLWQERMGDALFTSAQAFAKAKDYPAAIARLDTLLTLEHRLAAPAAFDRGAYYEAMGDSDQAIASWQGFLRTYPQSELVDKTALRLAQLLKKVEQFGPAAGALVQYQKSVDPNSPLFYELSLEIAELYFKGGQNQAAISQYKRLANGANTPSEDWFTAVSQLIEIYEIEKAQTKANFWRQKALSAGSTGFESLAGFSQKTVLTAASALAAQQVTAFSALPLAPPFDKTLPKKQAALAKALDAYEVLAEFGTSPYYEESLHQLGFLYVEFANELIDSDRPEGLSELALEEYEILLEEQAFDFEEKGLDYYQRNLERLWSGEQNQFTLNSLVALQKILASTYKRVEKVEDRYVYPH